VGDKVAGATQNPGMMDILSVVAAAHKAHSGLHQPPKGWWKRASAASALPTRIERLLPFYLKMLIDKKYADPTVYLFTSKSDSNLHS
jgi:hypothetical protein